MRTHTLARTASCSLLATASLAAAQGVIDPGFEGLGGTQSPWVREVAPSPMSGSIGTFQCGVESVVNAQVTRNGYARLNPIYVTADYIVPTICTQQLPCGTDRVFVPGRSFLSQSGILLAQPDDYLELAFDFRTERVPLSCEVDCANDTDLLVAEVRLLLEPTPGELVLLGSTVISDDGATGSGGGEPTEWKRGRIGLLRNGHDGPFRIEIFLHCTVPAQIADSLQIPSFRAALEVDNVRLETFDLPCDQAWWACPEGPQGMWCVTPQTIETLTPFGIPIALAAADADAPAVCDRPCSNVCPGDVSGDGVVDGLDLGAILSGWGSAGPDGDVNDDGIVDGIDLGYILSGWGCGV